MADGEQDGQQAVWDPQARGGAGGWVMRPAGAAVPPQQAPQPQAPQQPARPELPPALPGPPTRPAPQFTVPPPPPPPQVHTPVPDARRGLPRWAPAALVVVVCGGLGAGGVIWYEHGKDDGAPPLASSSDAPTGGGRSPRPDGSGSGPAVSGSASASPSPSGSPSPSDSPSPSASADTAEGQAQALDDLLNRSTGARGTVVTSVNSVQDCDSASSVGAAKGDLTKAASGRDGLLAELGKLKFDKLSGGADAAAALQSAWENSAKADRAYADWAGAVRKSCSPGHVKHTASYNRANGFSSTATAAKKRFTALWNPIAQKQGLPTRAQDEI